MGNLLSAKAVTFLDIETTHLDASRSAILQITIHTDWEDGRQDKWTTKIKPRDLEIEFASKDALRICGYRDDEWEDAPYLEDVADEIAKRLTWGPLVAHNINFDLSHIEANLIRRGWSKSKNFQNTDTKNKIFKFGYPIIDTCALAYLFVPSDRQNLDSLREHFNLSSDNAHTSDKDVEDCRHIFYRIIEQYGNK